MRCHICSRSHWWLPYLLSSCHYHHGISSVLECNGLTVSTTSLNVCRHVHELLVFVSFILVCWSKELGLQAALNWSRVVFSGCKRDVEVLDRDETETFGLQFETRPRPCHFSRDRDRDRDVRFWVRDETETSIGRDRDIFRDLGKLSFISEVFFALHKCFF